MLYHFVTCVRRYTISWLSVRRYTISWLSVRRYNISWLSVRRYTISWLSVRRYTISLFSRISVIQFDTKKLWRSEFNLKNAHLQSYLCRTKIEFSLQFQSSLPGLGAVFVLDLTLTSLWNSEFLKLWCSEKYFMVWMNFHPSSSYLLSDLCLINISANYSVENLWIS